MRGWRVKAVASVESRADDAEDSCWIQATGLPMNPIWSEDPNIKIQDPEKIQIPSYKSLGRGGPVASFGRRATAATMSGLGWFLVFGSWCLSGAWILVLGVSDRFRGSRREELLGRILTPTLPRGEGEAHRVHGAPHCSKSEMRLRSREAVRADASKSWRGGSSAFSA